MISRAFMPHLKGYRFPRSVISYAAWAYYRFAMSLRDVEVLLAERDVLVVLETIRSWVRNFGHKLRHRSESPVRRRLTNGTWTKS
ncbi:hypothetical protein [Leisingera sp. JC11]|uniref:hypothetical protein n=1 Tax=Leisingera sp. JC11 TaxID=3042469 RepID=UPI00345453A0